MPTYQKCGPDIGHLANEVLCAFETHQPVLDARVKIDFLWAYPSQEGAPAIMHHGRAATGLCRKIGLRDRVAGMGDAQIIIDAEWWGHASEDERRALLDHELHHIEVDGDKRDDAGRPVIKLRKHDVQIGWFSVIADRQKTASQERIQAKQIIDRCGQSFWPELLNAVASVPKRFQQVAKETRA